VALEQLAEVRGADLLSKLRYAEHFARVSDVVRQYLGARYGFDGLESTTREILSALGALSPPIPSRSTIGVFLRKADLVKFAKQTPSEAECLEALQHGEQIVRTTMPEAVTKSSEEGAPGASRSTP
jgi:hypothetical protein